MTAGASASPVEAGAPSGESPPAGAVARTVSILERFWPELLVAGAVVFGLVTWRDELTLVAYLNDSAIHEQMVRYATLQLRAGHLPLEGWYPDLGLGSPQFLHYQSLGATLTGALGLAIGPDRAYALSLYLLVSAWPISVYIGARLFGLGRPIAALAAACAPFVVSITGVGFEESGYLWIGFGVWAQLWAMCTLPIAWGGTYRALEDRRYVPLAALFIAATIAFHFEMGYLAVLALIVLPFVVPTRLGQRLLSALFVAAITAALAAWVVVPLIHFANFAAINEFLQRTPDADSYGARQVLDWLATGHLFDNGRFPVLTILAAIGFVSALVRSRVDARRARPRRTVRGDDAALFRPPDVRAAARRRPRVARPLLAPLPRRRAAVGAPLLRCRGGEGGRHVAGARAPGGAIDLGGPPVARHRRRRDRPFGPLHRPAGAGLVTGRQQREGRRLLHQLPAGGRLDRGHPARLADRPRRAARRRSASTPGCRRTGERSSAWARCRSSNTSPGATSTRSVTRCAPPR